MYRPSIVCKTLVYNRVASECLMIRRSASDERRPNQWDLPGGNKEPDETVEAAVKRETLEEVGFQLASNPELVYSICEPYDLSTNSNYVNWLFFVSILDTKPLVSLSFEHSEYLWTSLKEARKLLDYARQARFFDFIISQKILD